MVPPPPGFEWDPEKARINLARHGISFDLAVTIFDGWVFGFEDDRFDYDEVRLTAYGLCHGVEIMVV